MLNNYPESEQGDVYKLQEIKSQYKFAQLSIIEKQQERYEKVTTDFQDFVDRFPQSKLRAEAEALSILSKNNIKAIQHEQTKTSAQL